MQCVYFPRTSPPYFTFTWVPPARRSWQLMHTKVFIDTHNHNQPLKSYAHFSTLPLPCPRIHYFSTLSSMEVFPIPMKISHPQHPLASHLSRSPFPRALPLLLKRGSYTLPHRDIWTKVEKRSPPSIPLVISRLVHKGINVHYIEGMLSILETSNLLCYSTRIHQKPLGGIRQ